jgi:hypothetical protein
MALPQDKTGIHLCSAQFNPRKPGWLAAIMTRRERKFCRNALHVRSASAAQARCAPTRSSAPGTMPESAGWSVPARCRNESPRALRVPLRSAPTPGSLSGSRNSCPPPAPNTLACTRRSRSAPETSARSRPHHARNPAPIPGSTYVAVVEPTTNGAILYTVNSKFPLGIPLFHCHQRTSVRRRSDRK